MSQNIVLSLNEAAPPELDGKMFQVHILPGNRLRLYPVEILPPDSRCPVKVGGERCGLAADHAGKHCWANGD